MISISIKNLWILFVINKIAADQCIQKSPCECDYENGFGYDLNTLHTTNYFEANASDVQYLFHPCQDTTVVPIHPSNATGDCNSYSVGIRFNK